MDIGGTVIPGDAGAAIASSAGTVGDLSDAAVTGDVGSVVSNTGTLGATGLAAGGLDDIANETAQWSTIAGTATDTGMNDGGAAGVSALLSDGQTQADRINTHGAGGGIADEHGH